MSLSSQAQFSPPVAPTMTPTDADDLWMFWRYPFLEDDWIWPNYDDVADPWA